MVNGLEVSRVPDPFQTVGKVPKIPIIPDVSHTRESCPGKMVPVNPASSGAQRRES